MRSSLDQPHLPNLLIEPTLSTSSATIRTDARGVLKTHGMWTTLWYAPHFCSLMLSISSPQISSIC